MDKLENIQTQKSIFTKWLNFKLKKFFQPTLDDLSDGFQSGRRFYSIASVLCEDKNFEIPENLNDEKLISKGISKMAKSFGIPNSSGITEMQLLDKNDDSAILTFTWWMICAYFAERQEVKIENLVSNTLIWCQKTVSDYLCVNIGNFTNSWRDGCALLALIHSFKPKLFDYECRLSKTSGQNVTLGLHLASQEFECSRLLEIDHFTSSMICDWKSICLFIMELKDCIELTIGNSEELSDASSTNQPTSDTYLTQCQQTSRSFQFNIEKFKNHYHETNDNLERVLQKINVAKVRVAHFEDVKTSEAVLDIFETNEDLVTQFTTIKESVMEHESLMEQLTIHQNGVQKILLEGNNIKDAPSIHNTDQVKEFINENLESITKKWDLVFNNSTEFRKVLQKYLNNLQLAFLLKIEDCINELETKKNNNSKFGRCIGDVKEQLKVNRDMEMKIEAYEPIILMLQHFLIISEDSDHSDDECSDSDDDTNRVKRLSKVMSNSTFEEHIQAVGIRWNDLVNWVHSRYNSLQKTLLSWRHFDEEVQSTFDWLEERICSADQLARKSSRNQFGDFVNYSESKWGRVIAGLDKSAQKVKDSCNTELGVVNTLDGKIEHIVQEWNDASEKWRDLLDHWTGPDSKRKSNRAASFSDMSSDDCVSRRNLIGSSTKQNAASSQSDMDISIFPSASSTSNSATNVGAPSSSSSASNYKHKFEKDAEQMMCWLESSEEKLELITLESLGPDVRPTLMQQKEIIQAVLRDMEGTTLKKQMQAIRRMGKMYQTDLEKNGENSDEIDQLFEELDERWTCLENHLVKSRDKVSTLELSADLEDISQKLQPLLEHFNQFINYNNCIMNLQVLDKQLIEATNLREELLVLKNNLKYVTDKYQIVKINLSTLNAEIFDNKINELFDNITAKIQTIEEEQIKMRNNRAILEMNLGETEKWISNTFEGFNERFSLETLDRIDVEMEKTKKLNIELDVHSKQMSSVKIPDSSSRRYKIITDLQKKSRTLSQKLNKRQTFLNDLSENIKKLKNQTNELDNWLSEVDNYVDDLNSQNFDDNEEIVTATIQEIDAGVEDLNQMMPTLHSITGLYQEVETYFSKELQSQYSSKIEKLRNDCEKLREKYQLLKSKLTKTDEPTCKPTLNTAIIEQVADSDEHLFINEFGLMDVAVEHTTGSTESLDQVETMVATATPIKLDNEIQKEIEKWIDNSKLDLSQYSNITNTNELCEFGDIIQKIKNKNSEISEKSKKIESDELKNEILLKIDEFNEYVNGEYKRYEESNYHLQHFQDLVSDEDKWVGKVDRAMQQSYSCNHLDVEELSENIDEIERAVCDRSEEELSRLEDLKRSLLNARVLERSVSMEFDEIKGKSKEIKIKAEGRLSSLQQLLSHLQSVERGICDMTKWIHETTNLMKTRIASDMLGSDLPDEFNVLKLSFEDWEKFLVELKELEENKCFMGKKETSDRLKVQRMKLMKSFNPLKELFARYSRPGDFDPKLDNLKRETSRINDHIYLLDIISFNPDDIKNCCSHAEKFTECLKSLETDLKYVYELGKKLVERKEIDFSERVSLQLDCLKNKYHELLTQIKEGDEKLKSAEPLIVEIAEKRKKIQEFLCDENEKDEQEISKEDYEKLTLEILELCEKLKPFTDFETSEFVRDIYKEVADECKSVEDKLNERIEEKFDHIYSKTNQLCQAAVKVVNNENNNITNSNSGDSISKIENRSIKSIGITATHESPDDYAETSFYETRDNSFTDSLASPLSLDELSNYSEGANIGEDEIADSHSGTPKTPIPIITGTTTPFTTTKETTTSAISGLLLDESSYNNEQDAAQVERQILQQISSEMRDHIHSFLLFCQQNLTGSGLSTTSSSNSGHNLSSVMPTVDSLLIKSHHHAPVSSLVDLKAKLNSIRETVTEMFREQRVYLDHRLRELSAYAETAEQMENLDKIQKYWKESIGKLSKRIDRMEDLSQRLDTVEEAIKDQEMEPNDRLKNKALRLLGQLEDEMHVSLPRDRLRVTSNGRLSTGSKSQDFELNNNNNNTNNNVESSLPSVVSEEQTNNNSNTNETNRDGLKIFREQLKEVNRRLNSVRIAIDDSRRGCVSKLSIRMQEIDDNLTECAHMLADVQYSINNLTNNYYGNNAIVLNSNSSSSIGNNNDVINLSFLVDAQKKRLGKYNREFQNYMTKWMENAARWQDFIERLENLQNNLDGIEQEIASAVNGLDYTEQESLDLKKQLNSFEKKLIHLEQEGDSLSSCCNDVDADFLRNRLSELRSRVTTCCQNSKTRISNGKKKHQKYLNNNEDIINTSTNEKRENSDQNDGDNEEDEDEKEMGEDEEEFDDEFDLDDDGNENEDFVNDNEEYDYESNKSITPRYDEEITNETTYNGNKDTQISLNKHAIQLSRNKNDYNANFIPMEDSSNSGTDNSHDNHKSECDKSQTQSGSSSEELSTMIYEGGTASCTTVAMTTVLDNWFEYTKDIITNQVDVDHFKVIDELETKINEITLLKKEALQKIAQITINNDQKSQTDTHSMCTEVSSASNLTKSNNNNVASLADHQDLLRNIDKKLSYLTEIKVEYYLIDEQIKKIDSNIILYNTQKNTALRFDKSELCEYDIQLIREMIVKMPNGLKNQLEQTFKQVEQELNEIFNNKNNNNDNSAVDEYNDEEGLRMQEHINQIALLLKAINTFIINSNINGIGDIERHYNEVESYQHKLNDHREILQTINKCAKKLKTNSTDTSIYFNTVDKVNQLWDSTETKLEQRKEDMQRINEMKKKLVSTEKSLRLWLSESNDKLDMWLTEQIGNRNIKVLEEVKSAIPTWQHRLNEYQSLSCELTNINTNQNNSHYSTNVKNDKSAAQSHSTNELNRQLEEMNKQWSMVMNKVAQCTREGNMKANSSSNRVIEAPIQPITTTSVQAAPLLTKNDKKVKSHYVNIEKLSGWLSSLEGQLETVQMSATRLKTGSGIGANSSVNNSVSTSNADKLKQKLLQQLNDLKNEISIYEHQFEKCSELEETNSEFKVYARWKNLKDKYIEIRQSLETTTTAESGQSLLTKLRLLNDWLAHKDAELLEMCSDRTIGSYGIINESLGNLERLQNEVESHRSQIEENLEQAQIKIGETIDATKYTDGTTNLESEGESDNSDTGSSGNVTDDKNKKINRRIRRHSHHLKRKWVELSLRLRDANEDLKNRLKMFKTIDVTIKECHQMLSEIEFHIDNWSKVSNVRQESITHEINITKNLLMQSNQPLLDKLITIETQKKQLQKLKVNINQEVADEISAINSRITSIKTTCENRIKQLIQLEMHMAKQQQQQQQQQQQATYKMKSDNDATYNNINNSIIKDNLTSINDITNSSNKKINFPAALSENQNFIELKTESVSYPWERCLHPSGSQVPYYKNHSTQDTQWDHPVMAEMIKSFDELSSIKFSAYRTAMKLRALQKTLCFDLVDLTTVLDTFRLCGLNSSSVNERLLDVNQIIVFLASLYKSVNNTTPLKSERVPIGQKQSNEPIDIDNKYNINSNLDDKVTHSILGCAARGSSMRRQSRSSEKGKHTRSSSFGGGPVKEDTKSVDINKNSTVTETSCIRPKSSTKCSQAAIMRCSALASIPSTRLSNNEVNVPLCTDIALNWLLNVFDSPRNGKIRVLSLKVAMVILSNSFLDEKYKHLFSLVCNSQGQMDSTKLSSLLTDCVLIPKNLNESTSFTDSIEQSVSSCFKNNTDNSTNRHMRLSHFMSWLRLEPQILVWLPVLHRLISAENSVHQAKCGVCKVQPIVGLRYRCLRCFNFDLCQACFFYSKTSKSHKVSHPMQEYCNVTSSKENIRDYSRIFRNRFRSKSRLKQQQSKLGYPPAQDKNSPSEFDIVKQKSASLQPTSNSGLNTHNPNTTDTVAQMLANQAEPNKKIHSKLEQYASRLAEVEKLNKITTNSTNLAPPNRTSSVQPTGCNIESLVSTQCLDRSDEEHRLIAEYTNTLRSQSRNESILPTSSLAASTHATVSSSSSNQPPSNSQLYYPNQSAQEPFYRQHSLQQTPTTVKRRTHDSTDSVQLNYSNHHHHQQQQQQLNSHNIQQQQQHQMSHNSQTMRSSDSSLNRVIHGLEMQKLQLLAEYDRLQATQTPNYLPYQHGRQPAFELTNNSSRLTPQSQTMGPRSSRLTPSTGVDDDLATEARLLRQHKGRLEARMGVLEQHNRQLETQLIRLRQMLTMNNAARDARESPYPTTPLAMGLMDYNSPSYVDQEMVTAAQFAAAKKIQEYSTSQNLDNTNRYLMSDLPQLDFPMKKDNYTINTGNNNLSSYHHLFGGAIANPRFNPGSSGAGNMFYGSLERGSNLNRTGVFDYSLSPNDQLFGASNYDSNSYHLPHSNHQIPSYLRGPSTISSTNTTGNVNPNNNSNNSNNNNNNNINNNMKAASETGGSLSETEFHSLMSMNRNLADSCPAVTLPQTNQYGHNNSNSIGSLFHMAGQVGKAVGQLVDVMNEDMKHDVNTSSATPINFSNNTQARLLLANTSSSSASVTPIPTNQMCSSYNSQQQNDDLVLPSTYSINNTNNNNNSSDTTRFN